MTSTASSAARQLVPPDGGWGWMIVVAYAMANIVILPTVGSFGLIFGGRSAAIGLSATDLSLITNVNAAFGMSMGLVNGPLLKRFGCRRVAMAAGVLLAVGFCATATARTMAEFLVFYGVLTAAGLGLALGAFSLSLNQYFRQRRSQAIGICMTITGLGPILYPPLIAYLLHAYGTSGTVALLGALCGHVIAAALLLQPIEWHLRPAQRPDDVEMSDMAPVPPKAELPRIPTVASMASRSQFGADHRIDAQSIYGIDHMSLVLVPSKQQQQLQQPASQTQPQLCINSALAARRALNQPSFERSISHVLQRRTSHEPTSATAATATVATVPTPIVAGRRMPFLRWFESGSVASVHLASSVDVFADANRSVGRPPARSPRPSILRNGLLAPPDTHRSMNHLSPGTAPATPVVPEETSDGEEADDAFDFEEPPRTSCLASIVAFFDLRLFADATFVNIMLGMSLAIFAELNFSILMPFMLLELGYSTAQLASCMSLLAGADICARFAAPFVGECAGGGGRDPRLLYMASLAALCVTRVGVFVVGSRMEGMLVVCALLGVAKGFRTVYMQLVIPAHVPIERLAAAAGLQMVVNGVVIMVLGPLVGVIRDGTGSYERCVWFINVVTLLTLSMWTAEFGWKRWRRSREVRREEQEGMRRNETVASLRDYAEAMVN